MRVLVADDDEAVLLALELLLRREGIETRRATSPAQVLELLGAGLPAQAAPTLESAFDALLLDLNYERDTTSGQEGFALRPRRCATRRGRPSCARWSASPTIGARLRRASA